MEREEKYIEELGKIEEEINLITKRIAQKIKEEIEPVEERKIKKEIIERKRILVKEYVDENDKRILQRCIKKKDLVDGAWYETDEEGGYVARYCDKAQWLEEENHFLAPGQQQYGMDGYLDYFGDVIHTKQAGFPPMKRVD
jgi:hypothetical protein